MKRSWLPLAFSAFAAAVIFAACTGPSGTGLPAGSTPGTSDLLKMTPRAVATGLVIRHIYADLNFDGTTFTVVSKNSCGHRGLGGMTPFVAPTDGPLVLSASPSLTPRCVPSPAPSTPPQLYIFAIALRAGAHHHGPHFNGVPVAGPANLTDNPWVFAPMSPGLTMVGGKKYDFVVATSWQHPSPEPSASSSP